MQVRVWLWIIFSGWWLALFYLFAAVGMCMTVVFIPFGIKAFWFVMYALTLSPKPSLLRHNTRVSPHCAPCSSRTRALLLLTLCMALCRILA